MQLIQFFSCITHAIAVMVAEKQISFELASLQVSRRSTDKRMNKRTTETMSAKAKTAETGGWRHHVQRARALSLRGAPRATVQLSPSRLTLSHVS